MFRIIPFQQKYRDDTIFCLLLAKDALCRLPRLNEDLLDIQGNYFDKGDMFWIALDDDKRVVGMVGTTTTTESDMWLRRFYVKPSLKKNGLGSAMLSVVEDYAKSKGIEIIHTRFAEDYVEALQFYSAKGFIESERSDGLRHFIKSI